MSIDRLILRYIIGKHDLYTPQRNHNMISCGHNMIFVSKLSSRKFVLSCFMPRIGGSICECSLSVGFNSRLFSLVLGICVGHSCGKYQSACVLGGVRLGYNRLIHGLHTFILRIYLETTKFRNISR